MREFFQIVLLITLFVYCINLFLVFIGAQMGIEQISNMTIPAAVADASIDQSFDSLNSTATGGFNTALTFGDWIKPINSFISIVSLQAFIDMMQKMGFPESFTAPMGYITAILGIGSFMYLISGRQ